MIHTTESHSATAPSARLSLRVKEQNPLHHLWNNNGTWWIHYTLHLSDYTAKRVRRRDEYLNQISLTQRVA